MGPSGAIPIASIAAGHALTDEPIWVEKPSARGVNCGFWLCSRWSRRSIARKSRAAASPTLAGLCGTGLSGAFSQVLDQLVQAIEIAVPCEHESRRAPNERVESPAARAKPLKHFLSCFEKYSIRLDRMGNCNARYIFDPGSEMARAAVGVPGVAQPR